MKRITLVGCVLICLSLASTDTTMAQELGQLLEAVDKTKQNLRPLIEQEAQARKDATASLDKKLSGIAQTPAKKPLFLVSKKMWASSARNWLTCPHPINWGALA